MKVIVFVLNGRLCSMNCTGALAGQPELPRRLPFSQMTICEAAGVKLPAWPLDALLSTRALAWKP